MASKKITKQMKHSILNKAMDWKFAEAEKKHEAYEEGVAEKVYAAIFSPALQAAIESLPSWMLISTENIKLDSDIYQLVDPDKKRIPDGRFGSVTLEFAENSPRMLVRTARCDSTEIPSEALALLPKRVLNLIADFIVADKALYHRQGEFREKLSNLLDQVGTTTKLIEIMPEGEEWLPEVYHCSNIPQADAVADLLKI